MFRRTTVGAIGSTVLAIEVVRAEEAQDTKSRAGFDGRYEQSDSGTSSAAFPSDDLFRPSMADPNQPQFFAAYQSIQLRSWRFPCPGGMEPGLRGFASVIRAATSGMNFSSRIPGVDRVNLSVEEVEAIVSYERRWIRMYVGGGCLIHGEPAQLDQHQVQSGRDLWGPTSRPSKSCGGS